MENRKEMKQIKIIIISSMFNLGIVQTELGPKQTTK